ncbi:accessory gene regulator ArgB-like protein [Desulforamulus aeronauticus]|uniref:Accessory gene regulator B n=1 Tax=Desulforamulus aeronauticus DSM 10349 TaxID=1121421 RepID=A0A1M6WQQ3_9FIRM|nr:accessory gene regulator B family protein [Desulforamulus aeronauticus]SHK96048.1 accessory gene regulator B [Desulforamulus aeronauticus DSM 10349]
MNLSTLAGAIAVHVAETTGLEEEKIDTVRFGLEIILGALIKGIVLFSLAYLFGVLPHVVVGLITAGMFRMLSGDAHCTSYSRCLAFGVLVYLLIGKIALVMVPILTPTIILIVASLIAITSFLCTVKWVPGEVPYRTMSGPREILLFKFLSLVYLFVWLGLIR